MIELVQMGSVLIHVVMVMVIHAVRMPFVVYLNTEYCACVQMAIVASQRRDVPDLNALLMVIVNLINVAKLAHAEIHAYNLARVVLMPSAALLIDKHTAHAHHHISVIHKSNVIWRQIFVHGIHVVHMQNVATLAMELMNAFAHQIVLVIRIKDAFAVNRNWPFALTIAVDVMPLAVLLLIMNRNVIAHLLSRTETHIMNVSF